MLQECAAATVWMRCARRWIRTILSLRMRLLTIGMSTSMYVAILFCFFYFNCRWNWVYHLSLNVSSCSKIMSFKFLFVKYFLYFWWSWITVCILHVLCCGFIFVIIIFYKFTPHNRVSFYTIFLRCSWIFVCFVVSPMSPGSCPWVTRNRCPQNTASRLPSPHNITLVILTGIHTFWFKHTFMCYVSIAWSMEWYYIIFRTYIRWV